MKIMAITLMLMCGLSTAYGAAADCKTGQDYLAAARQKAQAADNDQASELAQQAVDVCPSYGGYELLAESRAMSLDRSDRGRAADAFVSAHELASSGTQRAHTLYEYAQLLYRDGDPQNAYPLIKDASALDPQNADIAALTSKIKERVDNPSKDQIVRGLWNSMYKPLRVATIVTPQTEGGGSGDGGAAPVTPVRAQAPSVNIPINFETGTTMVDERTSANIAILAEALATPDRAQQHFTFVGHADIRGVEANNVSLSKRRAEAICQTVVTLQPSLRGRIDVVGRGSSEPIDLGNNEEAYRANRRLQVLLK